MTPDSPTLYEVLEVCPDATDDQIKTAWRRAAKVTHPDAGGTSEAVSYTHLTLPTIYSV